MITLEQTVSVLHLCVALLSLAILLLCWRVYRVDALRDRLFELRSELFDFAADRELFRNPAYTELRSIINGMIRFAHKITFLRLLLTIIGEQIAPPLLLTNPFKKWTEAVEKLPSKEDRQILAKFHGRMIVLVVKHMITGSPFLWMCLTVAAVWVILQGAARRFFEAIAELFAERLPGLDLLEAQALASQEGVSS